MLSNVNFQVEFEDVIKAKENFKSTLKQTKFVNPIISEMEEENLNKLVELLIDSDSLELVNKPDKYNNDFPFKFIFKRDLKDNQKIFSCCYLLTSPTGKQYVGQCHDKRAIDLRDYDSGVKLSRWQNGNGYKENLDLNNDIQSFGFQAFNKQVLFTGMNWAGSLILERFMIEYLNTFNQGYNQNEGGGGVAKGYKQSFESRLKRSLKSIGGIKKRSKYQGEKDGVIIQFNTQQEGEKLTGVPQSHISRSINFNERTKGYLFSRVQEVAK